MQVALQFSYNNYNLKVFYHLLYNVLMWISELLWLPPIKGMDHFALETIKQQIYCS